MENHNFKTLKDVIRAMLDGQVFYFKGSSIDTRIYFCVTSSNFRAGEKLLLSFKKWKDWQIQPCWTNNLSLVNPVRCNVGSSSGAFTAMRFVCGFEESLFVDTHDTKWTHAEPIKPEECYSGKKIPYIRKL